MILLDTSAWIYYFRNGWPKNLNLSEIVTCAPIIQEILQGINDDNVYEKVKESLSNLPILSNPIWVGVFNDAANIYRDGRKKGFTIRSSIDCLISAIALAHKIPIIHNDRDFDMIAKYTPLEIIPFIKS